MKWIKLKDKIPDINIDGQKILIYRITNSGQSQQAMSIHDTDKVKYCNKDETWWMPLPEIPTI
jgi:hypothetical protein